MSHPVVAFEQEMHQIKKVLLLSDMPAVVHDRLIQLCLAGVRQSETPA